MSKTTGGDDRQHQTPDAVSSLLNRVRRRAPSSTGAGGTAPAAPAGTAATTAPGRPPGDTAPGRTPGDPAPGATSEPAAPDEAPQDVTGLASRIAATASRLLGAADLDPETDLFDAGASSVAAVEFVAALRREHGVRLSLDDVFADARPRRLAEHWLAARGADASPGTDAAAATDADAQVTGATTAVGAPGVTARAAARPGATAMALAASGAGLPLILDDLARADALPFVAAPDPVAPRRILLTGATGFLGAHLLFDLLRRSDAHVVCLVRAADQEAAERKLADALTGYLLPWSGELRRRITVLLGDIGKPHLGLDDAAWRALADDVDSVVSVGAAVDFLRGYASLRQTNVLGPLTLAELAATGAPKPLHQVSSTAVYNELGIAAMDEDSPLGRVDRMIGGYNQSKWAAEVALRRAREHGLRVTLFRPGGIAGHTVTGAHNPLDLSTGLLGAFTRMRTLPAFRSMNVAPVDWISRVVAAIICDPDAWGQTYNLTGRPGTLDGMVREMQLSGMNVEVVDWEEWRADFLAWAAKEQLPQLDFLVRMMENRTAHKLCEAFLHSPAATSHRTDAFVARHNLPPAEVYGAEAQTAAFERMAQSGVARLPHRDDEPYLSFGETMRGRLGAAGAAPDTFAHLKLTLSVAGMYQLVKHRRVDVREGGTLRCARLHAEPLTVTGGDLWVRPQHGVPRGPGIRHPLLRYRLRLRDADGRLWWLEGQKTARARRDLLAQCFTLAVEIGREGEDATVTGVLKVPRKSYLPEQVDGIKVKSSLSGKERRLAKLTWMAWFGSQIGQGLMEPMLRAGAELLDLRADTTPRPIDHKELTR
ncbi:thioester reductase domain-containing protein [Streptomyces sp. NPDC087212]|uniref:thioester reductase domain-containing protein n=1 Tax=Streptomyces sp. NPDC087212 TaxID=3365766 RepID=UPI0038169E96